ncbi:OmpW family protein [Camelimonas abortus]|uniref:OmpW family protein n=1 Tax=Camelimonas abortus TaxID=1017184 RepID=A0ABV7LGA6_9HYPH
MKPTFARAGLLAGLLAATALTAPAFAADLPARNQAPEAPVVQQWNPWMVRARALLVVPRDEAKLYTAGERLPGANVDVSNSVVPELDITYFFTKNLAAELILGVTPHRVKGAGSIAGTPVGKAWLLPPTLTLQYHFTGLGAFRPYVGAGVNYTVFFDERARGPFSSFRLKDSFGFALQAGLDYMIDEHWGFNVDVKKIFLKTDVKLDHGVVYGKVHLDPWLVSTGVTYRF